MRTSVSLIALLSSFPGLALANFDPFACNGVGSCSQSSNCNYSGEGYNCPSGLSINFQKTAGAKLAFSSGQYSMASDAEFPTCYIKEPGPTSIKLKREAEGVTWYAFMESSCETTATNADCYNFWTNPSTIYYCRVFEKGRSCTPTSTQITSPSAC